MLQLTVCLSLLLPLYAFQLRANMTENETATCDNRVPGMQQVHLLSFGDNDFKVSVEEMEKEFMATVGSQLTESHTFSELPEEVLHDPRWQDYLNSDRRGYGWFWKPALANYLIKKNYLCANDTVVYVDAGCSIGKKSALGWREMLAQVSPNSPTDMLVFQLTLPEREYTKGNVFERFGVNADSKEFGTTNQVAATYFLLRVGDRTKRFLQHWEKLMEDFSLVADEAASSTENPSLKSARSDQSIFSLLVKSNEPLYEGQEHSAPVAPRHKEFGIPDLKVLVREDIGWPVRSEDETQPLKSLRRKTAVFR